MSDQEIADKVVAMSQTQSEGEGGHAGDKKRSIIVKEETGDGDDEVHIIYLNVPEGDEPQVLDLSNLLAQEGIQVSDTQTDNTHFLS